MGLFGLFKSKEEKFRSHVRACFDECVKNAIKKKGSVKDPLFDGMKVEIAIALVYKTMINDPKLFLVALKSDLDTIKIVEEERDRALSKYLDKYLE